MIRRQGRMACRRIRSVDALSPGTSSIAKVVTKSAVRDQIDEVAYWAGVSLEERVAAVEDQLEVELRMRFDRAVDAARDRMGRVRSQGIPFVLRHLQVEPGKHRQPLRQRLQPVRGEEHQREEEVVPDRNS